MFSRSGIGNFRNNDQLVRDGDVVYAIRRKSDGMVKIGRTEHLKRRMVELRKKYGDIELLGVRRGYLALEKDIHARFDEYRFVKEMSFIGPKGVRYRRADKTEWFTPAPALLEWIKRNMKRSNINA